MTTKIQNLLDKYFAEKTNAAEETELRNYFSGSEVAAELEIYRPIFQVVQNEMQMSLGSDFDQKIIGGIVSDLTEKYFEGETSIAEEQDLLEHFSSNEIAPEFKAYQTWFAFLREEKNQTVSEGFEENVLAQLGHSASDDIYLNLTQKYFDGETSVEEEISLKKYYQSEDVSAQLQVYQSWFKLLNKEAQQTVSADFSDNVINKIKGKSAGLRVVSRRNQLLRVAAGVALFIGAFWGLKNIDSLLNKQNNITADAQQIDWSKYEVQSEAEAIAEAEEAMRLLAKAFGKGTKKAAKNLNKVGDATKVLN